MNDRYDAEPQHHEREAHGVYTRQAAFEILENVLQRRQPLDQSMELARGMNGLNTLDRAFVRMVVATTLRRLGQIDDLIRQFTDKPEAPSPPALHTILRMGIAQILFMDVPDHAAVDTNVELASAVNLSRQKGFINAILRRCTREGAALIAKQDAPRLNTPEWLMKQWIEDYGLRTAAEIAQANLSEAPLDITLKVPEEREHWAEVLDATILPTGTLRRPSGGNVHDLPGFNDGMWWVQDAASAMPARLFGADLEGKTVLDLCAAPGGKTAQLAAQGANVLALDRAVKRLKRLEENMKRVRLEESVTTEIADAAAWQPRDKADFVLVDAPCTATGTVRRHPDVIWLKQPQDLESLVEVQRRILDNAAKMLNVGGTMIYCTCSIQKAEGEHQIEGFLQSKAGKGMQRKPFTAFEVGNITGALTEQGELRLLPSYLTALGGIDGFYAVRLVKAT